MEEKTFLTVKEFAKEAGISTQRVYQLLAKDLQSYCKVIGNTKYINISALERFITKPICKDLQEDLPSDLQALTKALQDQIDTLQKHNDLLTQQLEVKDKQINTLTESLQATTAALTSAQALHAGTLQERLTVQTERSDDVPQAEETKRGILKRIFKRK